MALSVLLQKRLRQTLWEGIQRINILISLLALSGIFLNSCKQSLLRSKYPGRRIVHLAFTPDSRTLVGLDTYFVPHVRTNSLHVWDVETGKQLWTVPVSEGPEAALPAISPDGTLVAFALPPHSAGEYSYNALPSETPLTPTYTISLHEARSGRPVQKIRTAWVMNAPKGVCLSANNQRITLYDEEKAVIYDRPTGKQIRIILWPKRTQNSFIDSVLFTKDGKKIIINARPGGYAAASPKVQEGSVSLWNVETSTCERVFAAEKNARFEVKLSPNGMRLALLATDTPYFSLFDLRTGKRLGKVYQKWDSTVRYENLMMRPDNETVTATRLTEYQSIHSTSHQSLVWKVKTGKISLGPSEEIPETAITAPNGNIFASRSSKKGEALAFIGDAKTGWRIAVLEGEVGW